MRRSAVWVTVLALVAAVGLVAPELAGSAPANDPRAERERVRAEKAAVAAQIDTSKASLGDIDDALQTLQDNLSTQEAALRRTQDELAQAVKDVADAEAAIKTLTEQLDVLRAEMRSRAVRAYVNPPGTDILSVLDTDDFTTASSRRFYIELRAQDDAELADRLDAATTDLAFQRRKAQAARKRSEAKLAEQQKRTEDVRVARDHQQELASSLEATIADQVARSVELAATDRQLSAQIAREQAQLAARLAALQAARQQQQQPAAPQPARTPAGSGGGSAAPSSSGSSPASSSPTTTPAPSNQQPNGTESGPLPPVSGGGSAGSGTGGVRLCNAGGITVNCAISGRLTSLLNAARAAGLSLSGGGYRDPSAQIALRRAHCGSSNYAIYQMSPSSCRPPTARPGQSQHELGLAVDFNACQSRSSACYRWLAANAGRFGFYNLPSEPWHWSSTGQ